MNRVWMAGLLAVSSLLAQKQPQPKSQKELEAIQAMFNAPDADARIAAADNLIKKFADTEFKPIALYFTAASYEQKNDFEKMVFYAEETLKVDSKNFAAMLMLAGGIAKRTREHDLDKEEKLATSDKQARAAIEALKTAAKPNPQITDEQWEAAKKDYTASAHEALGLAAMLRKKYDVAIAEMKMAVDGAPQPDPATMIRLGQIYNLAGKPDDAIALLDKVMAMPACDNLGQPAGCVQAQIKQFAQAERVRAMQAKGVAKPAAPPAAPAAPAPAPPKP